MNTFTVTIYRKDQVLTKVVNKDSFTIGRSLDCDISINETLISRVHLVVSRRWNQIWIEDKNSSNGTFINGTRIVQSTPVNVVTADRIQLGKSEYILAIDLKTEEVPPEMELPKLPPEKEPVLEEPKADVEVAQPSLAPFQAEKILHEAKRKAAQIILEGETQAEKRVQVIYQKARDAQSQGEIFYQTRMSEAHKEADAILADFQRQGHTLLHEARTMAQEIREEVDVYVQTLKEKTRGDVENIISEATLQAERLKVEALDTARANGQQEIEVLLKKAQEEADRIVEASKLQVVEIQESIKGDKEALLQLEDSLKKVDDELVKGREALQLIQAQEAEVSKKLAAGSEQLEAVSKSNQQISEARKKLEEEYKKLQEKQAHLSMDVHDLETKKNHLFKEYEGQKIFLNEKLEKEKSQILRTEEERLEEMRLENSKRLQKMEQDILDDVIRKKEKMVKEIHSLVEREIVKLMEPQQWNLISAQVEQQILEAVDGRVASLSQSSMTSAKPVDLMKKRKSEKMRWATAGLAMGALVYFISQVAVEKIGEDKSPLKTIAAAEAKKRQDDLEKRKFNPPQAEELKDTYTDSVIYTRNYPEIYLDTEFQQKLYKASAHYLLKTWRVDEERSLQVLSASNALVKELIDRKSKIHPDFIKEGLEKMRVFENQTLARMKDLLGSEVRLDSYRRFERNFYREEVQRRRMAQH
ncbi:FHA domain-containing protein [Bdellovibrio svalbardensis]|uniref:FHA domain-containing protein n=1 Tax=Bdellovibrio svalbardensis TaxID=2972972 RepID=A0ABT6DLV3_9BACT|nr:FHA domain-containing protein [Bdellovibrio svalbardensis]MDG0817857.1 FHA domain-containing protein [Bdellovibrio svalbardensis]